MNGSANALASAITNKTASAVCPALRPAGTAIRRADAASNPGMRGRNEIMAATTAAVIIGEVRQIEAAWPLRNGLAILRRNTPACGSEVARKTTQPMTVMRKGKRLDATRGLRA